VGTNLNNDGILLYEGMAVFFVAQAAGIQMDFATQLTAAFICILGTIGIAGIPEAGFITLSLVLTTVGLPTELLPMLLTVDWILGRGRSVVNVLGDMTVSIALDNPLNLKKD
jgi:DAACS family dicarboxylate/amino acid:cation (Na+ or H+) symporter